MTGPLLVTGGTGLLGSAVLALRPDAVGLSQADGDLRDRSYTERHFNDIRPGQILHLAALVGGVQANASRNGTFFEDNVLINTNVLAAARSLRVPRLITRYQAAPSRSIRIVRLPKKICIVEFPSRETSGYATTKRMLDLHIRLASRDHDATGQA